MDERVWKDMPLKVGETVTHDGVIITHEAAEHCVLISGNIGKALKKLLPVDNAVGLGEDIGQDDCAIRIGRESMALFSKKPINLNAGWYEEGYAVSNADGKYCLLEISGEHAEHVLAQGASIAFKSPSPSAAIEFAGLNCLLVKQGNAWLLFVERPMLTYVSGFLAKISIGL